MDREAQLSNVSFGGAWSEEIAGQEALHEARRMLEEAVRRCAWVDLHRDPGINAAVERLAAGHPKGSMLVAAWAKAVRMPHPGLRAVELGRIVDVLSVAMGAGKAAG